LILAAVVEEMEAVEIEVALEGRLVVIGATPVPIFTVNDSEVWGLSHERTRTTDAVMVVLLVTVKETADVAPANEPIFQVRVAVVPLVSVNRFNELVAMIVRNIIFPSTVTPTGTGFVEGLEPSLVCGVVIKSPSCNCDALVVMFVDSSGGIKVFTEVKLPLGSVTLRPRK